jgi:hypothetical protein
MPAPREDASSAALFSADPVRPVPPRDVPAGSTGDLFGADDLFGESAPASAPTSAPEGSIDAPPVEEERRGLFGKTRKPGQDKRGVRDWLGVGHDFDARKEGAAIGSWDHFTKPEEEEDEDAGVGWKGGAASIGDVDDPGFASSEAARIRRKVTMGTDRDLSEKEVWFVATGAEEVGTIGMKAFLKEHGPDVRDAFIINIDNVGSGSVYYVDSEGMAKRYRSDRRLAGAARRAITENELSVSGRDYRGLSTDATPALARGFRAMSVMAFDINGRLPNWHWATDTVANVDEKNLETAAEFVCAVIKEL